jgi:hypothetical protein
VAFDFTVDLSQLTRAGVVQASPAAGRVAAGEKAHIKLKVGQPPIDRPCGGCGLQGLQVHLILGALRAFWRVRTL